MLALLQDHLLLVSAKVTAAPASYSHLTSPCSTQFITHACAHLQMTTGPMTAMPRLQLTRALHLQTLAPHKVSRHQVNKTRHAPWLPLASCLSDLLDAALATRLSQLQKCNELPAHVSMLTMRSMVPSAWLLSFPDQLTLSAGYGQESTTAQGSAVNVPVDPNNDAPNTTGQQQTGEVQHQPGRLPGSAGAALGAVSVSLGSS